MLQAQWIYKHAQLNLEINLHIQQGILGIVGASGAGKTTILRILAGFLKPEQGQIMLNQRCLFDAQQSVDVAPHQRKIALIFQQALLFPHLNVLQNLRYAEKFIALDQRKFHFEHIVELLNIKPLLMRKAHQLSGGEAQRISIGRALLSSPELLLLDEPLTGLDSNLKQQLIPFLRQVQRELHLPMLYVTHHLEELQQLEAQIYRINEGVLQ